MKHVYFIYAFAVKLYRGMITTAFFKQVQLSV